VKEDICSDPDDHQMFSEICLYIASECVNSMACSLIGFGVLKLNISNF
jgi:hypothetical protein